jgi:hypothetical protein
MTCERSDENERSDHIPLAGEGGASFSFLKSIHEIRESIEKEKINEEKIQFAVLQKITVACLLNRLQRNPNESHANRSDSVQSPKTDRYWDMIR